jgi:serine/threonine kinase PknH
VDDPGHPCEAEQVLGLASGDRIGGFRIERPLGEGAIGVVYLALREEDGELVALKVLKPGLADNDVFRARFLREVRVAGDVRHPQLVPVLAAGEDAGRFFLASAYVDGGSLADRLETAERLSAPDAVATAREVAAGLQALHAVGIVHRDVKPDNVLLTPAGAALTDFGLAKGNAYTVLTKPGEVMGTLDYIAPELISGGEASPASDLYALGCLLYECLTGAAPFASRSIFQVAVAHIEEEPEDPSAVCDGVPAPVGWVVLQALAKDPERRPPSAAAFAAMLRSTRA